MLYSTSVLLVACSKGLGEFMHLKGGIAIQVNSSGKRENETKTDPEYSRVHIGFMRIVGPKQIMRV